MKFQALALCLAASFSVAHGDPDSSLRRELDGERCIINSFSVYNPNRKELRNKIFAGQDSVIILDEYENGKFNYVLDTSGDCACIQISFAGTVIKNRKPPFSLYGETADGKFKVGKPKLGKHVFEAISFVNSQCSSGSGSGTPFRANVSVEPIGENVIFASPFQVTYKGSNGNIIPSAKDNKVVGDAMCKFLKEYFGFGFSYKGNRSLTQFGCKYFPPGSYKGQPLELNFEVYGIFSLSSGLSTYTSFKLPTTKTLDDALKNIIERGGNVGPRVETTALSSTRDALKRSPKSPYSSVNGFSIRRVNKCSKLNFQRECTYTGQCQRMYSRATDCSNGSGGVCFCGSSVCGCQY